MVECKNCGNGFEGNYCNQCGQAAATHRINFKFLWHDIQHGLFHFNNGMLYSLGQLCLHPGYTIYEYIKGKRVGHFKPLSMVVVLSTVYGLLKHFFLHEVKAPANILINNTSVNSATINAVFEWVNSHGAIMALLIIPIYSLASYLAYRKEKYNFVEHLVLNAYTSSLRLFITIILFPLVVLTQHTSGNDIVSNVTIILEIAVTCWCFIQFFNNLKWLAALKKLIHMYLIFILEIIVIGAILVTLIVLFVYPGKT
jgi:hypothetical protein